MMRIRSAAAIAVVASRPVLMAACDDDLEPRGSITASGQVENRTSAPLPEGARVIIAWSVSAGSDYTYVFGQGVIAGSGETFSVDLDSPPPDSALNNGVLGVGLIVAVAGAGFEDGHLLSDTGVGIIGIAGQYAVIYVGDREGGGPDWMDDFPDGYSVGVGVDVEGGFDAFTPVGANEVELIIDDLGNIDIVNWT
jgi:hypothetical protein